MVGVLGKAGGARGGAGRRMGRGESVEIDIQLVLCNINLAISMVRNGKSSYRLCYIT